MSITLGEKDRFHFMVGLNFILSKHSLLTISVILKKEKKKDYVYVLRIQESGGDV
jgi:hypothetical protein